MTATWVRATKREGLEDHAAGHALAEAEVVKLDANDADAEERIREFFGRTYVVRVNVDPRISELARGVVRRYGLKPLDAVHVATAIQLKVPLLETYDQAMIDRVDGKEGTPALRVRVPTYEGQMRLSTT